MEYSTENHERAVEATGNLSAEVHTNDAGSIGESVSIAGGCLTMEPDTTLSLGWPPLVWSESLPEHDGWYWWRRTPGFSARILQVFRRQSGRMWADGLQYLDNYGGRAGEWAGPIPEPDEPKTK